jgi:hypothetical protein
MDDNINLYTRLNLNRGNLLDNLGRSVQINQTLVNSHLEGIPGIGTLSTGRLTGGNPKLLGGHTDGSGNLELLGDSRALEVGTYLLDVLNITRGKGDTYTVYDRCGTCFFCDVFLGSVSGHDCKLIGNFRLGL